MIKVLSAWNFRASERRAELVRAMPSAAENLEEEAVRSEATVTGYEVPGSSNCNDSAWKAVRHRTCLNHPTSSLHWCRLVRPTRSPFNPLQLFVFICAIRGQKNISQ